MGEICPVVKEVALKRQRKKGRPKKLLKRKNHVKTNKIRYLIGKNTISITIFFKASLISPPKKLNFIRRGSPKERSKEVSF